MPFHTYVSFWFPWELVEFIFRCWFYARVRCQLRLAGVTSSFLPLPSVFLRIATQSVRFVFPSAFFLLSTLSLLLFFYFCLANLYLSPREAFAKRRLPCTVICEFKKKKSYAAIRNSSFAFWGVGHVPVDIQLDLMLFVIRISSLMSLFQNHVACQNFTPVLWVELVFYSFRVWLFFFLKHSNILQKILVSLSIYPAFDQDFEGKFVS